MNKKEGLFLPVLNNQTGPFGVANTGLFGANTKNAFGNGSNMGLFGQHNNTGTQPMMSNILNPTLFGSSSGQSPLQKRPP